MTISRLCKTAGIEGFRTNHSLRATAATRLGVDEQLVMERTGHRSLEGVRSYKRTSDLQHEALSDILNCKVARVENSAVAPDPPQIGAVVSYSPDNNDQESLSGSSTRPFTTCSNTNIQTNTKQNLPGTFNFNSCASVTFNIKY